MIRTANSSTKPCGQYPSRRPRRWPVPGPGRCPGHPSRSDNRHGDPGVRVTDHPCEVPSICHDEARVYSMNFRFRFPCLAIVITEIIAVCSSFYFESRICYCSTLVFVGESLPIVKRPLRIGFSCPYATVCHSLHLRPTGSDDLCLFLGKIQKVCVDRPLTRYRFSKVIAFF